MYRNFKEMYDAVCADCGIDTQVPFKPTRPVYCRNCYPRHKGPRFENESRNHNRENDYDRNDRNREKREVKNMGDNKFEEKRIKPITQDMIERTTYNNMVVDQLGFYDSQGKYINVTGKQLNLFTLTPSAPTIICRYIGFGMTITDSIDKRVMMQVRMCSKDEPHKVVCRKTESCPADLIQLGENGFWVVCDGIIDNGEAKMPFKIGFFDKIHRTYDPAPAFSKNPDEEKAMSLLRHYNGIKSGVVSPKNRPKPGNEIFRTLFSHENEVSTIIFIKSQKLRTGEKIQGIVKGYEEATRGQPSLKVWTKESNMRPIDISQIDFLLVNSYKAPMWRKISIELLMQGHLILPHPEREGGMSIDVCGGWKGENDLLIHSNGDLSKRNDGDKHNREVMEIIEKIKKEYEDMNNNTKKMIDEEE